VFTIGSVLCGTATTFTQMVIYRVIQGIGGGALIPVSQAIMRENFNQREQGMAMAMWGMGVVLAPAMGPILGGWLTDHYGWPWVFYINLPVSIVGILMVMAYVHDPPYLRRGIKRVDWLGIILLSVALTSLQIVMERGEHESWFESHLIQLGTAVCVLSVLVLIYWELKTDEPVVNFRILRNKSLSLGAAMGVVFGIALFGSTFIIPQFTQNLLGYPAFDAALVLAPRAMTLMLCMPLVGRLYRRAEPRMLVIIGILVTCWAYYDLAHLSLSVGPRNMVPILVVMGIGMPFVFVTMSALSLSTIARVDMTDASSLYTLARRVGGNVGYALAAALVSRGLQVHRVQLVSQITPYNLNWADFQQQAAALLGHAGLNPAALKQGGLALINLLVSRHAAMMAYNDVSWIMGGMFLATLPLAFLLPSRQKIAQRQQEMNLQ
ncbi:MAG: DHA2 family efflux MFS transporter permease subunit, partial [Desulfobacteraceae bacterium]|nr:DHA2 family efflux MFS transporter permease subunit [Desulfobacteraceae bacterium]